VRAPRAARAGLRRATPPAPATGALLAVVVLVGLHQALPSRASSSIPSRRAVVGRSVGGRPIVAFERRAPRAGLTVLVVGCIHGDECAGTAIAHRLESLPLPPSIDLWVVPDLNPDGAAAGTRQNAHGVDLNRNFPWHWQRLQGYDNAGPRPLSEPESRTASRLIGRIHPRISVWFHQHLGLVDESGGRIALERHYAALVGLPVRRLTRFPGSVASWENRQMPGTTAFVVELPPGRLGPRQSRRFAQAVLDLAR
jgi:protein MpaA